MDGRGAEALADWLTAHPGVQVVCRDRSGAFAEGIRLGAPDAQQCADRWHLYQNLCDTVDKTIRAHRADLREPVPDSDGCERNAPMIALKQTPVMDRTRRRHAEIHELLGVTGRHRPRWRSQRGWRVRRGFWWWSITPSGGTPVTC